MKKEKIHSKNFKILRHKSKINLTGSYKNLKIFKFPLNFLLTKYLNTRLSI